MIGSGVTIAEQAWSSAASSPPPAANGLLTGLTEAWLPDSSKAMIGQKTGLNTNSDAGLTYVSQAGFPGGHALENTLANAQINLDTSASALLQAIGNTDFLMQVWGSIVSDTGYIAILIGEAANNGVDFSAGGSNVPTDISGEIPGGTATYPFLQTSNHPFTVTAAHLFGFGYTNADATLRLYLDGAEVLSLVNIDGVGSPDATNFLRFTTGYGGVNGGFSQLGFAAMWQGTAGVANAVSNLGILYSDKLQFSDFT